VTTAGIGAWLIVGIPLTVLTLGLLMMYKPLNAVSLVISAFAGLFLYPGLPLIMIKFYRTRNVELTFKNRDPRIYGIEQIPLPVLSLAMLLFFYWLVAHVPIFFNGVFPLFGLLLSGLPGIGAVSAIIICLPVLIWGVLKLKKWGWWGTLFLLGSVTVSTAYTLAPLNLQNLVSAMHLPPLEVKALQGVPLLGWHLILFISLPVLATLGLLFYVKPYFSPNGKAQILDEKLKAPII
jgi:hypothetical protein